MVQACDYGAVAKSSPARAARERPAWVPDEDASHCMIEGCSLEFWPQWPNDVYRRHHCRSCGWVVCKACLAPEPVALDRWVSSKKGHPVKRGAPTKAKTVCRACVLVAPTERDAITIVSDPAWNQALKAEPRAVSPVPTTVSPASLWLPPRQPTGDGLSRAVSPDRARFVAVSVVGSA